jgi:tetratricopeptide (TPR) repeat protein
LAGDPDYDYLLGIAALDSGKPNEAIFALERALAVNPSHLQARAEIARAYLAAGEVAEAKQEFETVQQQNPPKEVSVTIQKFLDIIETTRSGQKTTMHGYVEVMVGNDSNVNSSTSNRQIAVPLFAGALLNLNASGIATSDTFGSLGTGFNIRHALSPTWSVLGGANISKRNNSKQIDFNTSNGDANIGVNLNNDNDNYLAAIQAQSFVLANVTYRNATGLTTQWQRNLNSGGQLSSYLQYSSLTYPDYKYRNADRYVVGGAYGTPLGADSMTVIYLGLYGGAEQPLASGYAFLANSFYGARMGGEIKLNAQYILIASASMESRMHDGADPLFLVKRNDTQADLKLGMNYLPDKQWTISPSISYTNNDSNIVINKYDRTIYSVSVRRDFN